MEEENGVELESPAVNDLDSSFSDPLVDPTPNYERVVVTVHKRQRTQLKNQHAIAEAEESVKRSLASPRAKKKPQRQSKSKNLTLQDIEDCVHTGVPPNFYEIWAGILKMREDRSAPVDSMGCDRLATAGDEPRLQRFQVLTGVFLSSQTQDQQTAACVKRLKEYGLTPENISQANEEEIAQILYGVGFYRTKAKNLIKISKILLETYDGDIPPDFDSLCSLPGVGAKMALITMSSAWGKVDGIAVDVHVHRISNRLQFVSTKTPEETCLELAQKIPKDLWAEFNVVLVGFGQQRCKADPQCDGCLVRSYCPYGSTLVSKKDQKSKNAINIDSCSRSAKLSLESPE